MIFELIFSHWFVLCITLEKLKRVNTSTISYVISQFSNYSCALLELWNEGYPPFDLSHLLSYRTGKYTPQKHLDNIEDLHLRTMLSTMIQRDPTQRLSAEVYLSEEKGRLFPEYFYSFLQPYMLAFSTSPIISPDDKILRLKKDMSSISKIFGPERLSCLKQNDENDAVKCEKNNETDGLVIVVSLVTSCIRGLHDCASKEQSLEILLQLTGYASEETILDRILPYIVSVVICFKNFTAYGKKTYSLS